MKFVSLKKKIFMTKEFKEDIDSIYLEVIRSSLGLNTLVNDNFDMLLRGLRNQTMIPTITG